MAHRPSQKQMHPETLSREDNHEKHKTAAAGCRAFCRVEHLRRDAGRGLEACWPGWLLGRRQGVQIEKGHIYWVGEFSGTFFNDKEKGLFDHAGVKCPAWDDIDLNDKKEKGGGYCVITDLDGDQAYLTWQNAGAPGPGQRGPGTFEWTGGTGKYKEIKGSNTFVGVTQVNWPDGTATGYATWNR